MLNYVKSDVIMKSHEYVRRMLVGGRMLYVDHTSCTLYTRYESIREYLYTKDFNALDISTVEFYIE